MLPAVVVVAFVAACGGQVQRGAPETDASDVATDAADEGLNLASDATDPPWPTDSGSAPAAPDVAWMDAPLVARDCRPHPGACNTSIEGSPELKARQRLAAALLHCGLECGRGILEIDGATGCVVRIAAFKRSTPATPEQLECLVRIVEPLDWSDCGPIVEAYSVGCGPK